jgi:hypothetical protein
MFPGTELGGTSWPLGPGYYTRTSHLALATVESIVIPPGFRVKVCNASNQCTTYAESKRTLPSAYANRIENVQITLWANAAAEKGFTGANQWFTPGTYKASQGQLAVVAPSACRRS